MSEQIIPYKLDRYKRRLLALADHLETVPQEKFNMGNYRGDSYLPDSETLDQCGTVGCALGHAPSVLRRMKVTVPTYPYHNIERIDFDEVSKLFGISPSNHTPIWDYLFSGGWTGTDNTPLGASQRIRWVLANGGIPIDYRSQIAGCTTLSYKEAQ